MKEDSDMNMAGSTVQIAVDGSGIGKGLAAAIHNKGSFGYVDSCR